MIWLALLLFFAGLMASALFSGLETGFYRAARIRLVLDALEGDPIARVLVWFTNYPSLFVATILVGNNLANYVTSFAVVLGVDAVLTGRVHAAEIVVPLLLAPVVFVYAELLPKSLFLQAPNRLLRRAAPLFLPCVPLFFPVSGILWALNRLLARWVAEPPEQVRLTIARRELRRLLTESHQTDVLTAAQRELARRILSAARTPVTRYALPVDRFPSVPADLPREKALQAAQEAGTSALIVSSPAAGSARSGGRELLGYVLVAELAVHRGSRMPPPRALPVISEQEDHIGTVMKLYEEGARLAQLVDSQGSPTGILPLDTLSNMLVDGRPAVPNTGTVAEMA